MSKKYEYKDWQETIIFKRISDELKRHRILFLCGPPKVGKTTLIQQLGYKKADPSEEKNYFIKYQDISGNTWEDKKAKLLEATTARKDIRIIVEASERDLFDLVNIPKIEGDYNYQILSKKIIIRMDQIINSVQNTIRTSSDETILHCSLFIQHDDATLLLENIFKENKIEFINPQQEEEVAELLFEYARISADDVPAIKWESGKGYYFPECFEKGLKSLKDQNTNCIDAKKLKDFYKKVRELKIAESFFLSNPSLFPTGSILASFTPIGIVNSQTASLIGKITKELASFFSDISNPFQDILKTVITGLPIAGAGFALLFYFTKKEEQDIKNILIEFPDYWNVIPVDKQAAIGEWYDRILCVESGTTKKSFDNFAGNSIKEIEERLSQVEEQILAINEIRDQLKKIDETTTKTYENTEKLCETTTRLEIKIGKLGEDIASQIDPINQIKGIIPSILKEYIAKKTAVFLDKTNWPYDIDEQSFVKLIDYTKGDLQTISTFEYDKLVSPSRETECLHYISETLHNNPVICVGHYGMGKSTISKMLFKEWSIKNNDTYPIFLTLSYATLSNYLKEGLDSYVTSEIKSKLPDQIIKSENYKKNFQNNDGFQKEISELINSRKLLLILDGIDESIGEKITILNFIRDLSSRNCLVFLTCRLEYTPFFDAMETFQSTDENAYRTFKNIRLLPWQHRQWNEYGNRLQKKYPQKKNEINNFLENVNGGKYSSLPTRPLFFKMLSDLIINNRTKIKIDKRLEKNLSEIYYKFINWKICDDKCKKSSSLLEYDSRKYKTESFILLKEISLLQYKLKNETKGSQEIKKTQETNQNKLEESGVNITTIKQICRKKKFDVISEDEIPRILLHTSLFSIIRRYNEDEFIFSHKSFMEYLVAYNIAEGLLTKKGSNRKPECNTNWSLFQTIEVSDHLMDEIDRIRIMYHLEMEDRDVMLLYAFQSALEQVEDPYQYDPRIEEILYYIGKFKIKSPKIFNYLKKIIENEKCSEDYYRTASITLSRIVDRNYCDNYVLGLVKDLKKGGKRFEINKRIQLRYYGEANLKRNLKNDLDIYIAQKSKSDIISLKILTYFTSVPQKSNESKTDRDYLQRIYKTAETLKHYKIQDLCRWIDIVIE